VSPKTVVIIGTLDTKEEYLVDLKTHIQRRGHQAILIDISTGTVPPFDGDITCEEIAGLAGKRIEDLRASRDRPEIARIMQAGAITKVQELLAAGKLDAIVSLGGVTLASIGSYIMKALPYGLPKFVICTTAMPVMVNAWFDAQDITVIQSLVDFVGHNPFLENAIARSAGAVCGMMEETAGKEMPPPTRGSIAISLWGFSENCGHHAARWLEDNGYTVYAFHATGIGDVAMDRFISEGYFDGVIDIAPGGVMEQIFGGNRAAGPYRLEAAGKMGIPQVIAPSGINLAGCGPTRKIDVERFASRERVFKMDALRHVCRYYIDELQQGARAFADKLNMAKGPTSFMIPRRGWSSLENEGSVLYLPEEDVSFTEELRKHLRPDIEIQEVDYNLEDPEFAVALAEKLASLLAQARA
jgi:uncharacterized protein (UPF0261 family)